MKFNKIFEIVSSQVFINSVIISSSLYFLVKIYNIFSSFFNMF